MIERLEHDRIGEPGELAALYVAGAMTAEEVAEFESHLASGCAVCRSELDSLDGVVKELLSSTPPTAPAAQVRADLLNRLTAERTSAEPQVWKKWSSTSLPNGLFVLRKDDGAWEETGVSGVRVRRLYVDQARDQITMLVRMDPGSSYPRHVHNGPEECLVLEGDLCVVDDGVVLHAGDYQCAPVGTRHGVQRTDTGCLLMIISSLSDEIVHE